MLDDVEGLQALVAVADQGSFAAAGRAMRLSTNAVSNRIARLEERLGTRLFERTTRLVRATDAGERLLRRARRVLEELDLAERDVSAGNLSGTVRVALPPDLVGPTLMSALARAMATAPGLKLELFGRARPADPRKESVDLVVWGGPRERIPSDLTARDMGSLAWSLAASAGYIAQHGTPRTPSELSTHRCLLAHHVEPERAWHLVNATNGSEVSVPVSGSIESDHPRMLLEAMVQGLGIGVRPAVEVQAAVARGDWVHVLPEWRFKPIPVALVAVRGRLRQPSVRLIADAVEASLRLLSAAPSHYV